MDPLTLFALGLLVTGLGYSKWKEPEQERRAWDRYDKEQEQMLKERDRQLEEEAANRNY